MLTGVVIALIGIVLGVFLAWALLSGVLALAFKRVREVVRRLRERRGVARPGPDRREAERRDEPTG